MPDEFELPETPESTESHKERRVGLIIAGIAVALAIVTHMGNETNYDKILAHVDSADQFAFFQAKKDRAFQLQLQVDSMSLINDKLSPDGQAGAEKLRTDYAAQIKHLDEDGKVIKDKGSELLEHAEKLEKKATFLESGEIALQISIVLCSITILTEQSLFVRLGLGISTLGILSALWGMFGVY